MYAIRSYYVDVNFFLNYSSEERSGRELIIDVLNSQRSFIPLEDVLKDEILSYNFV